MNEQDWIELGKRAIACEGFRWMPGMRESTGERVLLVVKIAIATTQESTGTTSDWTRAEMEHPDLRDPATIGCLLHLVREAWGDNTITVDKHGGVAGSYVFRRAWGLEDWIDEATEAEALVATLEAAPKLVSA